MVVKQIERVSRIGRFGLTIANDGSRLRSNVSDHYHHYIMKIARVYDIIEHIENDPRLFVKSLIVISILL